MDDIGPREIELKIHGLVKEDHGRVPGRVFANKLKQLISALEAADVLANGLAGAAGYFSGIWRRATQNVRGATASS